MNSQDMSILSLVLQASWVVQLVMLLLLIVSVSSWAAIFRKLFALKRVKALNEDFERDFWSGTSLNDLYASAAQNAKNAGPMERIFASGMREYQKLRERRITDPGTLLDGARRAMRASFQREMDVVESSLSFLGSVASVSPYVGLFGTVWGIMHAFTVCRHGASHAGHRGTRHCRGAGGHRPGPVCRHSGRDCLQPFCARHRRVANHQETFIEEFSNILQRNLGTHPGSPSGH